MASVQALVGYIRVSEVAGRADERFKSPALQREAMMRWAAARYGKACRWVGWHEDLDVTGSTTDRPALNAARDQAIDTGARLVVFDLRRFSRNVPEGLDALTRLAGYGVDVVSASEDLDTATPEGELSLTFLLAIGQYELRRTSATWTGVIAANRAAGWWHGVAPYGYRRPTPEEARSIGRTSGVIVPDEAAAPIVAEVFERFLEGESANAIGLDLVRRGLFTRQVLAREILRNPAYAGFVAVHELRPRRYKTGDRAGELVRDRNRRPLKERDPNKRPHLVEGNHKALVTINDWVRARRRLRATTRPAFPAAQEARWSADRLAYCGTCGRRLQVDTQRPRDDGVDYRYLRCPNALCTARATARLSEVDAIVAELVAALPADLRTEARQLAADRARRQRRSAHDPTRLRVDRQRLRAAIAKGAADRLVAEVEGDGALSAAEVDAGLAVLRTRLAEVDAKLAAVEEETAPAPQLALADVADTLAELWGSMTLEERRRALTSLGVRIVVQAAEARGAPAAGRVHLTLPWETLPPAPASP